VTIIYPLTRWKLVRLIDPSIVRCSDHRPFEARGLFKMRGSWHVPRCHPPKDGPTPRLPIGYFVIAHWSVCQKLNHVSSVRLSLVTGRSLCTRFWYWQNNSQELLTVGFDVERRSDECKKCRVKHNRSVAVERHIHGHQPLHSTIATYVITAETSVWKQPRFLLF